MSAYMDHLAFKKTGCKTYEEYLKSEPWIFFSNAIRKDRCWCCGTRESLQVHHKTYERLGEELPCDVVTVCGRCHKLIHETAKNGTPLCESHKIVARKFNGQNPKQCGRGNRRCKNWMDLCNPAFKEQPKDVAEFLLSEGLMRKVAFVREDGSEGYKMLPTNKACKLQLFKKGKWNKTRYLSMMRNKRREAKRKGRQTIAAPIFIGGSYDPI